MKIRRIPHAETRKANREQILLSATRVFSAVGYDAATIKDVIRESTLSQGTFYNYFKTKEEVFQEVIELIVDPIIPVLRATRKEACTAQDFLANSYEACRRLPENNADAAALIARNQSTFREMFYLGKGQTQIKSDLVADLSAGYAEGMFINVNFGLMADAMIALGVDLVIQAVENPAQARERVTFLVQLFSPALENEHHRARRHLESARVGGLDDIDGLLHRHL